MLLHGDIITFTVKQTDHKLNLPHSSTFGDVVETYHCTFSRQNISFTVQEGIIPVPCNFKKMTFFQNIFRSFWFISSFFVGISKYRKRVSQLFTYFRTVTRRVSYREV